MPEIAVIRWSQPDRPPQATSHTFVCERCHLLFMTEDHQLVSGPPLHSTKNL